MCDMKVEHCKRYIELNIVGAMEIKHCERYGT